MSGSAARRPTLLRLQAIKTVPFKKTALAGEQGLGHRVRNWDGISEQNRLHSRKRIFLKVCREADKGEQETMEEWLCERHSPPIPHPGSKPSPPAKKLRSAAVGVFRWA